MSRPPRQSIAQMQAACDQFNLRYKPGDEITVYTGIVGENPKRAVINHPAQVLYGHTAVVYVRGGANGSIALSHTAP